jgi:hypothetical protein
MYTMGRLVQLLVSGDTRDGRGGQPTGHSGGAETESHAEEGSTEQVACAPAYALVDALCRPSPLARPFADGVLHMEWFTAEGRDDESEAADGAPADGAAAEPPSAAPASTAPADAQPATTASTKQPPNIRKLYGGEAAGATREPSARGGAAATEDGGTRDGSGGGDPALVEAHEKLNRWYDEFLFEGMTAKLAEMAV